MQPVQLGLGLAFFALVLLPCAAAAPLEYYVDSVHGSDANSGTIGSPFRSLQRARDAVRAAQTLPEGGAVVNIRAGVYTGPNRTAGAAAGHPVLQLGPEDSGDSASSPVVYQSYQGEPVQLVGGVRVPTALFTPWKGNILVANLTSLGLDVKAYGSFSNGGLGHCAATSLMQLYFNGSSQVLARWPNIAVGARFFNWTTVGKVVNATAFQYQDKRIARWRAEPNGWLHGYWKFGWADNYVRIVGTDAAANMINTANSTPAVYGIHENARYYGVNLLCELDTPGEYYIDASRELLYFLPPSSLPPSKWPEDAVVLSTAGAVVQFASDAGSTHGPVAVPPSSGDPGWRRAEHIQPGPGQSQPALSYVVFKGLSLLFSRGTALDIASAQGITVQDCVVAGHSVGASIHGSDNLLTNLTVSELSCAGVSLGGGDSTTLTPGNNKLQYSSISRYSQITRCYQAGVGFSGVGNTYQHNNVFDAPHTGVLGSGNNHVFAHNFVHDLCYEVTDAGAWYAGRSWSHRGTVLINNTFLNIRSELEGKFPTSVQAIYFDDELCQHQVLNNTIVNAQLGIMVGGGRHHTINGNTFLNCTHAIHLDSRGLSWQKQYCQPGGVFEKELEALHYQQPPYSTAYPLLPSIFTAAARPCYPVLNTWAHNRYCSDSTHAWADFNTTYAVLNWNTTLQDNEDLGPC